MTSISDPLHGVIDITPLEKSLIDHRYFQRLRRIKQLGFTELAFPGATHSRFAHSVGAMHMVSCMLKPVLKACDVSVQEKKRLWQTVRLAVLLHDVGHAPVSHASEKVMPDVRSVLGVDENRQATHEDYTLKMVCDSELSKVCEEGGVEVSHIATLIAGRDVLGGAEGFKILGGDALGLFAHMVSGELDADRLDYLRRDAYYCGVAYGQLDHVWLARHMRAVWDGGCWGLGLLQKGVWGFENFLLARYHMFLSVYMHHTPTCFDGMLARACMEEGWLLPADVDGYVRWDDGSLMTKLEGTRNLWARAVVERRPYKLLLETHSYEGASEHREVCGLLDGAGVEYFTTHSKGVLSKYAQARAGGVGLKVLEPGLGRVTDVDRYTPLYGRFEKMAAVERIFCKPEHVLKARKVLRGYAGAEKGHVHP